MRLGRALFADHFDKKKFKILSINDGARIKILKYVTALVDRPV